MRGEALKCFPVLADSEGEIVGNAGIEGAAGAAGQDVHVIAVNSAHVGLIVQWGWRVWWRGVPAAGDFGDGLLRFVGRKREVLHFVQDDRS